MDKFSRIEVFAKVVEKGSFSKAAEALNVTKSAVSKHVQNLEDQLGVRLLNRTTRSISPTEEGQEFYSRCVAIIRDMEDAQEQVKSHSSAPSGKLKVSAPLAYGTLCLSPKIGEFIKEYPDISVELDLDGGQVNAVDEGMDITIFVGKPGDSSFIAKKIEECPMVLIATPQYLQEHGEPQNIAQLQTHKHIEFSQRLPNRGEWSYSGPEGEGKMKINEVFAASNGQALCYVAEKSVGIVSLPRYVCQPAIDSGAMVEIMQDYQFNSGLAIFAIFPHKVNLAKKVRLFVDWLAA